MKIKKLLLTVVGCIGVGLGAVGAVVPLLPAFPFLMLAAVCFAKSSERLNNWFIGTKLYRNNLESFVHGKGMTMKTKLRIMSIVTVTMAVGFLMMSRVPVGRIILLTVWVFHILYFLFGIKTLSAPVSEFTYCKEIEIGGMHCRQCAKKLECALNRDRDIYATVSFEKKRAVVKMKSELKNERLRELVQGVGYTAHFCQEAG